MPLPGPTYMQSVRRFHVISQLKKEECVFRINPLLFWRIALTECWGTLFSTIIISGFQWKRMGCSICCLPLIAIIPIAQSWQAVHPEAQCLKMKISFACAPTADIRLYCGVLPACWCDKCSSSLLLIRTESVTCCNIEKETYLIVHSPCAGSFIASVWEIISGEKCFQLPYETTKREALQPHITNNDREWDSSTRIMMSFVLAALRAPWCFKLFISSTGITQALCSEIPPHSPVI